MVVQRRRQWSIIDPEWVNVSCLGCKYNYVTRHAKMAVGLKFNGRVLPISLTEIF